MDGDTSLANHELHQDFERQLLSVFQHSKRFIETEDDASVAPTATRAELIERLASSIPEEGEDGLDVIDALAKNLDDGLVRSTNPRFFGWVIGGRTPTALAADWLASCWDQNGCLTATSPAIGVVEEVCGRWLLDLLGLPKNAAFSFVTGCQMAHATCLAAARHRLLATANWDVETQGLSGAPAIRIVTGSNSHGSLVRAVRFVGLGSGNIASVPADGDNRLSPSDLETELAREPNRPTIVVLQAGDINTGRFDPFPECIEVARKFGAWVHVDGAFGLWANASERHRDKLTGVEKADSWTTDGHKWLNVPHDSGFAFVADESALRGAMSHRASYLTHDASARDQLDYNPEWSKRFRALPAYAAIRQLGRKGIAEMIDRACDAAKQLVIELSAHPMVEVVCMPTLNQGMVRFRQEGATLEEADTFTDRVMEAVNKSREAMFTGTLYRGRRCMRISVSNWRTDASEASRAAKAVHAALEAASTERVG